jgi:pimeloyl-ACP methyl ester carboxylesterase
MRTTLVSIPTPTQPLDGAYHEPDDREPTGAVLLFHGNTMNFYQGAPRFLPPVLTRLGLACLAFNRRGHDILSTRDNRTPEGGAFQRVAEAIDDNRVAAGWLAERGFARPAVIGHSNGGMLAVRHVADHQQTPALVLLSAHCGGRNLVPLASRTGLFAGDRLEGIAAEARRLVAAGRSDQLMLLPGWFHVASAGTFVDLLTELPDVLALAPSIRCPVLYLRGDQEPAAIYPAEDFKARAAGECTVEIVADCGHFYVGREDAVAATVATWLAPTLGLAARLAV